MTESMFIITNNAWLEHRTSEAGAAEVQARGKHVAASF
jgi:hypothetical protein